jgi:hypothetical protein
MGSDGIGTVLSRSEDAALLLGRLLVAALLLPSGIDKLLHFSKWVVAVFDVAIEVVGPVTLIIGLWPLWTVVIAIAPVLGSLGTGALDEYVAALRNGRRSAPDPAWVTAMLTQTRPNSLLCGRMAAGRYS